MTNSEVLKEMSVDELTEFLFECGTDKCAFCSNYNDEEDYFGLPFCNGKCLEGHREWLESGENELIDKGEFNISCNRKKKIKGENI